MIAVALVSAYLFLPNQSVAADGIGGWPNLRWRMTKQQVEQAYPNFQDYKNALGATQFGLPAYYAAGCDFELYLGFWDNELYQINLDTKLKKDDTCRPKDTLSATYGQPEEHFHPPDKRVFLTWTTGDTKVLYWEGSFGVNVIFSKRDWKFPAKRL
jgi:hypothetical protein